MATSTILIVSIILLGHVKGFDVFGALRKLESRPLKPKKILFVIFILGTFICIERGFIVPKSKTIYLSNSGKEFETGFGLCGNSFLDDLLSVVFLATVLIGLNTDRWF